MDGVSGAREYKYKPGIGSCGDVSSHGRWAAGQGGEGGAVLVCALTCARQARLVDSSGYTSWVAMRNNASSRARMKISKG